jgi:MFS family permease
VTPRPDLPAGAPQGNGGQPAFAVFQPRRGRAVAYVAGAATLLLFALIAVFLPGPDVGGTWRAGDRVFYAAMGVAIAFLLWRFASIRAVPSREELVVRNLLTTRTVPWGAVADVRFGGGDPWVTIELVDTDTLAVMAIQRADGQVAQAEAGRLAALVQALGPFPAGPDVAGP